MLPIDGDSTPYVLEICNMNTRCEYIDVCLFEDSYMRIDLGVGCDKFLTYENLDECYLDAIRGKGGFKINQSLSSHG